MRLDIENAPSSPETTRSSYLYNGKVVNHNIEVHFSNIPDLDIIPSSSDDSVHKVHIGSINPNSPVKTIENALKMLLDMGECSIEKPKYAYVYNQIVGKPNDQYERHPYLLELTWG